MPSLVEIGPVVLEQIFLNVVNVFSLFCYNLNLAKGYHLYCPLTKDNLCQVWLKFAKIDKRTSGDQKVTRAFS